MELREPPKPETRRSSSGVPWTIAGVALLVASSSLVWIVRGRVQPAEGEHLREVSSKLRAAGALRESARVLDEYLSRSPEGTQERARMAYTLGQTYLDLGETEKGLRWFYEAETLDEGPLREELGRKIVHSLERLGRYHAAQAALSSHVGMGGGEAAPARSDEDPVVARIGDEEIRRSQVERTLDDLPPQIASSIKTPQARAQFLRQYVAEELLWRKAQKLEYDRDPEVERQLERVWRQLAMAKMVEHEVAAGIAVDETDLRNFFAANIDRYKAPNEETAPELDEVRRNVEVDYRQQKFQAAYDEMLESQLATAEVKLFAERMSDGD